MAFQQARHAREVPVRYNSGQVTIFLQYREHTHETHDTKRRKNESSTYSIINHENRQHQPKQEETGKNTVHRHVVPVQ